MTVLWWRRKEKPASQPLALQSQDVGLAPEIIRLLRAKAAAENAVAALAGNYCRYMSMWDKETFYEELAEEIYALAAKPWFEERT